MASKFQEKLHKRGRAGLFVKGGPGANLVKYRSASKGRAIRKQLAKGKGAVVTSQSQVRARRNRQALNGLEAKGVVLPPGTQRAAAQLRKGQTITLADGRKLRRSNKNVYSIVK